MIAGGKVEKTIPVIFPKEQYALGSLQWSADGKTIFAAAIHGQSAAVAEISTGTGAGAASFRGASVRWGRQRSPLDVSSLLSPDGKTLAASTACQFNQVPENAAMYLLDLASADRKVTKVPPPVPEKAK